MPEFFRRTSIAAPCDDACALLCCDGVGPCIVPDLHVGFFCRVCPQLMARGNVDACLYDIMRDPLSGMYREISLYPDKGVSFLVDSERRYRCIGYCSQCRRLSSRSLLCRRVAREGHHYDLAVATTSSYVSPRGFVGVTDLQSMPIPTSSRAIQTADSSLRSSTLAQLMLKLPCLAQSRKCCSRSRSQAMSCCRLAATYVSRFTQDIRYVVTYDLSFNALLDTAI